MKIKIVCYIIYKCIVEALKLLKLFVVLFQIRKYFEIEVEI